jgi:hypothetical protein
VSSISDVRRRDFKWAKEATQKFCGQRRHLLWEKMSGIDRLALDDISAPSLPQGYRSTCLLIPSVERTSGAPERKEWTGDTSSYCTIVIVVLTIDGRGGSILFAYSVNNSVVTYSLNVGRPYVWGENVSRRPPAAQGVVDHRVRCCHQKTFREWFGLRKQRPGPKSQRELGVGLSLSDV